MHKNRKHISKLSKIQMPEHNLLPPPNNLPPPRQFLIIISYILPLPFPNINSFLTSFNNSFYNIFRILKISLLIFHIFFNTC